MSQKQTGNSARILNNNGLVINDHQEIQRNHQLLFAIKKKKIDYQKKEKNVWPPKK